MIVAVPSDIGRRVIYRERGDFPGRKVEEGVLTSFNQRSAFVRYGPEGTTSAATDYDDLEWKDSASAEDCQYPARPDGIESLDAVCAAANPNATVTMPAAWVRELLAYVHRLEGFKDAVETLRGRP